MKIIKDEKLGTAYLRLRRGKVASSVDVLSGVILDLDKQGDVPGIEVLSMSKLALAPLESKRKKHRRRA